MVQSQEIGTNASIEESRIHIKHWFVMLTFSETQHFCFNLSTYITFKEYKRSKDVGLLAKKCGFQVRISYVLSCVHEQAILLNKGIPIHLNSIDKFWRKLDFFFSCTSLEDDDFGCEAKVNMHKEQFKTQPTGKFSYIRQLKNIITLLTTSLHEAVVTKILVAVLLQRISFLEKVMPIHFQNLTNNVCVIVRRLIENVTEIFPSTNNQLDIVLMHTINTLK